MRTLRRATVLPVAIAVTAVGLTACNDESGTNAGPSENTSAAAPSDPTSAPASEAPASSSKSSATSPATSDGPATAAPKSEREDAKDPSSLDAETSKLPSGPVTDLTIKKLGGYQRGGSGSGMFYAVLSLDATERGILSLQYVMLDKSGKELKTVDDTVNVAGTKKELKITRASGQLPPASEGTVDKVRLRVTKNASNQFATVTTIDPNISTATDPASKVPVVKGRYKTAGKASVVSLNAICSDKSGKVVAGNSPVKKIKAPSWTDYEVRLFDAPDGYQPTKCYVGS